MTQPNAPESLLRPSGGHAAVGNAELFFDLVSAFAVTQISHSILHHHDLIGLAQTAVLFLAVWWAWVLMVWTTNWLDPDRPQVRMMIFLIMLASLFMAASLPDAFGARGMIFALAYLGGNLGRMLWMIRAMRAEKPELAENLRRSAGWWCLAAPFWIGGALAPPGVRLALWTFGLAVNLLTPFLTFATPWSRPIRFEQFYVSGHHFAERCSLLIIIALGEYILMGAAGFAEAPWGWANVLDYVLGFFGSATLWWIYFDIGMKRGAEHIHRSDQSARVARDAYTYMHIPIVAGIVIAAVADEQGLKDPLGPVDPLYLWTATIGPMIFLVGTMFFKRATSGRPWLPLSHMAGVALLALIIIWALWAGPSRLALAGAILVALVTVCVWEWGSFNGGWLERGVPIPQSLRERAERKIAEANLAQTTRKSVADSDRAADADR